MRKPKLLVVDDEPNMQFSIQEGLRVLEAEVIAAATGREGLAMIEREQPAAVMLDVRLPDRSGLEVFEQIREIDKRLPVIIMTAYSTTDTAIEAMKRGAFEYLLKPVDLANLRRVVQNALEASRLSSVKAVIDGEPAADDLDDRIVGQSPEMQEIYKAIGRVAPLDVTVLVLGESGTGKELIARAIYQHSERSDGPFLAINCAAIPESLLESELFGHERGAFTGADRRRVGKFEQAHGGTLFLDEIGDMSPATQAKLLRVLQDRKIQRVGSNEVIETDVRVIAATNQDLENQHRFRQDLLYRLNVFPIHVPPLRERREDLPQLVQYFVRRASHELGRAAPSLSPASMELFLQHDWPGNVRELQGAIKYALVKAPTDVITPESLPRSLRGEELPVSDASSLDRELTALVGQLFEEGNCQISQHLQEVVDRVLYREIVRLVDGNQVAAAERLGVARNTVRARLRALGLATEKGPLPTPARAVQ